MNVADGFVSVITAVELSLASQLSYKLSSGAPESGLKVLNPPKTTCQ
jgi:hypothetical protein